MINNIHKIYNAKNERIKYKYKIHIQRALKKDIKTCKDILKHLREFEIQNDFMNFEELNIDVINNYINNLIEQNKSYSFLNGNMRILKEFYRWLAMQNGYKSKINYNYIDYFNLTNNQKKIATATEYQKSYELEEIFKTINLMPDKTIVDRRNKAIISLQVLCGLRISELRTVKLKNLIYNKSTKSYMIYVSPKDMEVKFGKTREAFFMPFPDAIKDNVLRWVDELKQFRFNDKDPLFPIIPSHFNQYNMLDNNIKKEIIKSNTTIRTIFKNAFNNAGYEYLRPHSFRHTIAKWAETKIPKFLNAVRQSLGHSSIETTFQSYGRLSPIEQGKIIKEEVSLF